jgi:predicted metal-dependent peptidase
VNVRASTVPSSRDTLARIANGLRMVTVPLPHLAGLAAAVRVDLDERVPTMGVFASGRLVANPAFVARLKQNELVFVLAHELLHLALRTHDRARGSGRIEFNYAHDYIINDILRVELGFASIPAGGLDMPGARTRSAEEIVLEMRRNADLMPSRSRVFEGETVTLRRVIGGVPGTGQRREALAPDNEAGDVLDEARERDMFPAEAADQAVRASAIGELAARSLALEKAMGALAGRGTDAGAAAHVVSALRGLYRTPWEMALQKWLESVAPGERTFVRPSRRGADRSDVVLPGRKRESWMLNVVLDTSGSMTEAIPQALGAIADFCETHAIDDIRLVQCDTAVGSDEILSPAALAQYRVSGFGGSDLSPALLKLADDVQVTAAVVITDGDIAYPDEPMPYDVLWVLPVPANPGFRPRYGHVIIMQGGRP